MQPRPDLKTFRELARPGRLVPVHVEFPFDTETAVTAYAKLRRPPFGFLLESVIGGERWARYSFVGSRPREAWKLQGDRISRWSPGRGWYDEGTTADPFEDFRRLISRWEPVGVEGLPRFWGGAVGFFGYDMVRWLEDLPDGPAADVACPDACFMLTDRVLAVDNLFDRAVAVATVPVEAGDDPDELYGRAVADLEEWIAALREDHGLAPFSLVPSGEQELISNRSAADFRAAVERVREYIRAGDAYQVVISQRMEAPMRRSPLDTYRVLRTLNPSPYLFLLELDDVALVGSSPEVLVRVEEDEVTVRPIAGTRRRGDTPAEDEELARDLVSDEKERSEHLMLVDLGRNDVSRVSEPGTVSVPDFMVVEKYSHVIHLVSEVTGDLAPDRSALDALRACFPAGTLTGAPKVRAMEIIDELEPTRRGPYGGAAGHVGYGVRSLDMAIAIRTILNVGDRAYVQAGAGIVHDSVPEREWEETRNKARALLQALAADGPTDPAAAGPDGPPR